MRVTLVFSLIISILMVVFALMNNEDMTVNFGFAATTGPIALVLIVTFVTGILAAVLAMLPGRLKRRQEIRTLRKSLNDAQQPTAPPPASDDSPDAAHAEPPRSSDQA